MGNWKMELSAKGEEGLAKSLQDMVSYAKPTSSIAVFPSFVSLPSVAGVFVKSGVAVGAQNIFWEERGAWTGQISIAQAKPYITWSLVGHSEVRGLTHISEEHVAATAALLLRHNIRPVVCIGETAAERDADQTIEKIRGQVATLLDAIDRASLSRIAIAYEHIWAIGSGQVPQPDEVSQVV